MFVQCIDKSSFHPSYSMLINPAAEKSQQNVHNVLFGQALLHVDRHSSLLSIYDVLSISVREFIISLPPKSYHQQCTTVYSVQTTAFLHTEKKRTRGNRSIWCHASSPLTDINLVFSLLLALDPPLRRLARSSTTSQLIHLAVSHSLVVKSHAVALVITAFYVEQWSKFGNLKCTQDLAPLVYYKMQHDHEEGHVRKFVIVVWLLICCYSLAGQITTAVYLNRPTSDIYITAVGGNVHYLAFSFTYSLKFCCNL